MYVLFALIRIVRLVRHRRSERLHLTGRTACIAAAMLLLPAALPDLTLRTEAAEQIPDYESYIQTVYSRTNGLPCGEANDIVQTNDGVLWIGTYAGLYRFNGTEFEWMDHYESVRNVNCLFVDTEGRMWIGTNDNGLSIVIHERVSSVVGTEDGLPAESVRCITQSTDGLYYIGTTDSMFVLTLDSGLRAVNTLGEVHYAESISADLSGNAAAVNQEGELFLMRGGKVVTERKLAGAEEIFTCCAFGASGELYVGTSTNHVYVFDVSGGQFSRKGVYTCTGLQHINSLNADENDVTYVCSDNGFGYLSAGGHCTLINTNSFNNSIDNMLLDYQGNLWLTSSRLGMLRLSESAFTDIYSSVGMTPAVVNSVQEWQGALYFGTDKGLDIVNAACTQQIRNQLTEYFEGVRIRCIRTDHENNLWIGTYGRGLVCVAPDGSYTVYNRETGTFGNRARCILVTREGTVAAAGDTGMTFIKNGTVEGSIKYGDGLANATILCLLETDDGKILAGTDGDGIAVINHGGVESIISRADGLSSGVILRMVQSALNGSVYIVTSNGVCCMETDGRIRTLDNFPYFNNYDIWQDQYGKLFVPGSAGIYVVDEREMYEGKTDLTYEKLDTTRGLHASITANSWNYCNSYGMLYISCDTGVYRFDMRSYSGKRRSYRLSVRAVRIDGADYHPERGSVLTIGREANKIEITPELLNYTVEDPTVSYYLEGYDKTPYHVQQSALSTVTYTNLPPGDFVFHLYLLDPGNGSILEESIYPITKSRELYDEPWFTVYMLLVAMLAVAWFTWFLAHTRMQRTLREQKRQLELAEHQLRMGNETILAIAKTVDAKDGNTSQHSQRVSEYSVMIARELGFDEKECENLRRAALLHDIGKIGIPDRILNKPARLTDEEYVIMKTHVTKGAEILKDFTLIEHVVDGARYHHERYDGTGYPEGLSGDQIPVYGRIIGVADAFDAMTANRVYRNRLDMDYVIGEFTRGRGKQFDPEMVDIPLRLIREGKIDVTQIYSSAPNSPAEGGTATA